MKRGSGKSRWRKRDRTVVAKTQQYLEESYSMNVEVEEDSEKE